MFSSTFQGKFNFQGLFKTVLYIQVLFKPVRILLDCFFTTSVWSKINVLLQASHSKNVAGFDLERRQGGDRITDRQTDGGNYNIPLCFLKSVGA